MGNRQWPENPIVINMVSGVSEIAFILIEQANGVELTPDTIGLSRFNEFNQQVADFIAGSAHLKLDDVHISVGHGSYKLVVKLTAAVLALVKPDIANLQRQDALADMDPKRAEIIMKWQTRAKSKPGLRYAIRPEGMHLRPIELSDNTDYRIGDVVPWVKVEKYLFGTVMDMGGAARANVHIRLDENNEVVVVGSDHDYLRDQKVNHLYRKVLVRVEAEQHQRTGQLRKLRLLAFQDYNSQYDEAALDRFAETGRHAWADVPDAGKWLHRLRGGT